MTKTLVCSEIKKHTRDNSWGKVGITMKVKNYFELDSENTKYQNFMDTTI